MFKRKGLNTYYLRKWRRAAKEEYRVLWSSNNAWSLQHFMWYNPAGTEYTGGYEWVTIKVFDKKEEAYNEVDEIRRGIILDLLKAERAWRVLKQHKIY